MISSKRPIVVYIEQARIPDETTSITRSEVPITGDIVDLICVLNNVIHGNVYILICQTHAPPDSISWEHTPIYSISQSCMKRNLIQ